MPWSDLSRVDRIIVEVLIVQHAVLVADEAVLGDSVLVELDLDFDISGDDLEGAGELCAEDALGLLDAVDVEVVAVAFIRQVLHVVVVVVPQTIPHARQADLLLTIFLDHVEQRIARFADVEVAIRQNDHAIVAAWFLGRLGHLVGRDDASFGVGRSPQGAIELADGAADLALALDLGGLEDDAICPRVGHDRDRVIGAQVGNKRLDRLLDQRELLARVHRARDIDEEDDVRGLQISERDILALHADPHQVHSLAELAGSDLHVDREGMLVDGLRVIVVEVVDVLFGPHRIWRGEAARVHVTAHHRVRSRVDIDGERGGVLLARVDEVVLTDLIVDLADRDLLVSVIRGAVISCIRATRGGEERGGEEREHGRGVRADRHRITPKAVAHRVAVMVRGVGCE